MFSVSGETTMPPLLLTSGYSMKRVSQLTALALLCGLASFSSLAADMPNAITLSQLQAQHGTPVDTRASAFYNGWPQTPAAPPGMNPPRSTCRRWLSAMSDEQIAPGQNSISLPLRRPSPCTATRTITRR
jgi:thiosulfate/3-mercaptopyruvate sulfurtransferase